MRHGVSLLAFVGFCVAALGVANAQDYASPKIVRVAPPGGKAGSTFEIVVSGSDLGEVEGLHFSFPGAKVEVLDSAKLVPEPTKGKGAIPKGMGAAPSTGQKFKVTLPPNAPIGIHDVRVIGKGGVSNARAFVVGDLAEVAEQEPNDDVPAAQKIDLDTTVSGVVNTPTDVDYYQFSGKKGQRVVIACLASSIDSRLPAMLELFRKTASGGTYLASNRNYREGDALVDATLPEDGEYYVRLSSFTYTQGGADSFYRLSVSTAPWIDAAFPPAVEPGKDAQITLYGRNLPGGVAAPKSEVDGRPLEKLVVGTRGPDAKSASKLDFLGHLPPGFAIHDGVGLTTKNGVGMSNPIFLKTVDAPIVAEVEPNDAPAKAQEIKTPCVIAGRIDAPGDRDCFAFAAKKGQTLAIDAWGDRLGVPMDLRVVVSDASGKSLLDLDDSLEVAASSFFTRTDDPPSGRFVAPEDGTYVLTVSSKDSYASFGPRHTYLVRLGEAAPSFQVVAVPASTIAPDSAALQNEGTYGWTALIFPQGGFAGNIRIEGVDLPPGIVVKPQTIRVASKAAAAKGPTVPQATIVASATTGSYVGAIRLIATADFEGRKIVREVRAGAITWPVPQAGTPAIARLERELVVAVRGKADYALHWTQPDLKGAAGDSLKVDVKLTVLNAAFKTPVQVAPIAAPPGLTAQPLTLAPGKETGTLVLDGKGTAAAGTFTLILKGQTTPAAKQPTPKGSPPNIVQYSDPLTVSLAPKQVAKLTPQNAPAKVSVGKTAETTVKFARLFEFEGPFTIEPVAEGSSKGLTFAPAKIAPGEETAKILLTADPGAPLGPATIQFRLVAQFEGTPIVHEGKLTATIAK